MRIISASYVRCIAGRNVSKTSATWEDRTQQMQRDAGGSQEASRSNTHLVVGGDLANRSHQLLELGSINTAAAVTVEGSECLSKLVELCLHQQSEPSSQWERRSNNLPTACFPAGAAGALL